MSKSESIIDLEKYLQPMDQDEISLLKKGRVTPYFSLFVTLVFVSLFIWLMLNVDYILVKVLAGLFCVLLLALFAIVTFVAKPAKPFGAEDLQSGQKVVAIARVENKREDKVRGDLMYYLTIFETEFMVPLYMWEKVQANQMVEIHFAPHSKCVFKLLPLP